jgi:hypothetical protein
MRYVHAGLAEARDYLRSHWHADDGGSDPDRHPSRQRATDRDADADP